jgi:hypothetical protein
LSFLSERNLGPPAAAQEQGLAAVTDAAAIDSLREKKMNQRIRGVWFAIDRAAGRIGYCFVVAVAAKGGAGIIKGSGGAWRN